MAIVLCALGGADASGPDASSAAAFEGALGVAGIAGGRLVVRRSPDGDPAADTLSCRTLAVLDLDPAVADPASLLGRLDVVPGCRVVGAYEPVAAYRRLERSSDLSAAEGLLLVLLNNAAAEPERAFVEWYDGTHMPEVIDASDFWIGTHYELVAEGASPAGARHVGLLETERADVVAAHHALLDVWPRMSQWPHELVHCAAYGRSAPSS